MILEVDSKCINSLKGIGILGVVLVHCGLGRTEGILASIAANGARGVQLLFIINAFLIFYSLSKIEFSKAGLLNWYIRKFVRIIPLYWFFTLLHLLVFGLGERYWLGPLPKVSLLNILCNMLFLHGFYPYYTNSINTNWFMADLAIFYLLAPLLYKLINSLERAVIALLLITPAGYILMHFALCRNVLSVDTIWADYVNILSFPSELPIMLLGILAYYVTQKCMQCKYKMLLSSAALVFGLFCILSLVMGKDYFMVFNNIFSFGVVLTIIFIGQMTKPMKLINNGFFVLFGKHSYGIYLSNIFLVSFTDKIFGKGVIQALVRYVVVVIGSLLIAVITEKVIEAPVMKLINQKALSKIGS